MTTPIEDATERAAKLNAAHGISIEAMEVPVTNADGSTGTHIALRLPDADGGVHVISTDAERWDAVADVLFTHAVAHLVP